MQVGDKVVCVDREKRELSFGETYVVERIMPKAAGSDNPYSAAVLYLKEAGEGYFDWRFRPLDEVQNENFIGLVGR